ncbi:hypothetical protein E8K88_16535 [Lampropedia aestuarii]|uniref:Uncharacterized protein n=1 Tax=Lampropedia aestuarii TaxID=2562762 RepID=A0A4S5BFG1_9BURK|nr:hypothetical protein [Lampropedia aestuarii]THJ30970.1 hypothetical protein E8K88_16535 [Lampropedia aestuarii]
MTTTNLSIAGLKAVEYKQFHDARKAANAAYQEACSTWRHRNSFYEDIERDSKEWKALMKFTATEYQALVKAKAAERNARERMFRACRKAA